MASPMKRGLQMWEQIGFSMNVSLYLELEGQMVSKDTIAKAWKALQAEHPVLRMGIEFCDNVPTLVELVDPTLRLETASPLYPKWQTKLQEYANEMRDWSEGVVFMELASSGNQHQLFLTINHAGRPAHLECSTHGLKTMLSGPQSAVLQVPMALACSTCATPSSQTWASSCKVNQ